MLRKKDRLTTKTFDGVFRKGKKSRVENGTKIIARWKGGKAVVVKKKDFPTAVERNRVRRRLYSALQEAKKSLPYPTKAAIWVFKGSGKENFEALKASAAQTLERP